MQIQKKLINICDFERKNSNDNKGKFTTSEVNCQFKFIYLIFCFI